MPPRAWSDLYNVKADILKHIKAQQDASSLVSGRYKVKLKVSGIATHARWMSQIAMDYPALLNGVLGDDDEDDSTTPHLSPKPQT